MTIAAFDRRAVPAGATFSNWEAADGWKLRLLEWAQPRGTKARGSLLFANGRGDFVEKYIEAIAHWHAQGWHVTSFDWRGQGDSRGHIKGGHLDSFDPLVADGSALLRWWIRKRPGPHVAIGHSMGGHLLLRIMAEHRHPLDAAVLVAPMIAPNASPIPIWLGRRISAALCRLGWREKLAWKQNERPRLKGIERQYYLTSCDDRYADELWWKERERGYDLGPPSWGWVSAAYRSSAELRPGMLKRVDTPTLLLGTARDRLVSPNAIRRAARLIPGAELLMFPDAAHELLRESDPVRLEVMSRIDAFLGEHAPT
jgi:lysophospholipase